MRHGQASIFSDNYDQLSEKGYLQSEFLGAFFKSNNVIFDQVFIGPLKRHKQTLDGILKIQGQNEMQPSILEGLREHQGFTILKSILRKLIEHDKAIKTLVNQKWTDQKDQIKHHIRIYENFASRWAKGEFDYMVKNQQNWTQFIEAVTISIEYIKSQSEKIKTTLVVTSGGPKAIAYGQALQLSPIEMMDVSWQIYNCAISEFISFERSFSLKKFNNVSFFEDMEMRTLV